MALVMWSIASSYKTANKKYNDLWSFTDILEILVVFRKNNAIGACFNTYENLITVYVKKIFYKQSLIFFNAIYF